MKKIFLLLLTLLSLNANSQTHVKGSILTSTTWTKANSPYIVDSTVTVFPNITLTIEPGVTVEFADSMSLTIQQASLIAVGTATDSITFTSNSVTPSAGIWNEVLLTVDSGNLSASFNYCNFRYASCGIESDSSSLTIRNSNFNNNTIGIGFAYNDTSSIILNMDSCIFINNGYGILVYGGNIFINNSIFQSNFNGFVGGSLVITGSFDTYINNSKFLNDTTGIGVSYGKISLHNCEISNNRLGIYCYQLDSAIISNCIIDSNFNAGISIENNFTESSIDSCKIRGNNTGISSVGVNGTLSVTKNSIENNDIGIALEFNDSIDIISCNKICNNTSYNLYYASFFNINASNNYWCTSDSSTIQSKIFDGHDSAGIGVVTFMPIDTIGCYVIAGVAGYEINDLPVSVYPNPASNELFIHVASFHNEPITVSVMNVLGQIASPPAPLLEERGDAVIYIGNLPAGMYFLQIKWESGSVVKKFVKE